MKSHLYILLFLVTLPIYASAQVGNPARADTASLQQQFDQMLRVSNRYQKFKVVDQNFLSAFMSNVSDSISIYTQRINTLQSKLATQENEVNKLQSEIKDRDHQITSLTDQQDDIHLLGMSLTKTTYNLIMWALVLGLFAALSFVFLRMRLALSSAQELNKSNEDLTSELEKSRKQRLKVEQDLRRQLQDEINRRS